MNIAPPPAYQPAEYEVADVAALKALVQGSASEHQQKKALDWIIRAAAGTYDLDYRPDSREHAFVSGRRFVGLQIVKLLNIDLNAIVKQDTE